jgi:hypothetical protein
VSYSVLLLGNDISWLEALQIDLKVEGWHAEPVHKLEQALSALNAAIEPMAAVVIAAFGNRDAADAAIRASEALRTVSPRLPLLFDISVPDYALTAHTLRSAPAQIVSSERPGSIVCALQALHLRRTDSGTEPPPRFAVFEVRCDVAAVTFAATLDFDRDSVGPFPVPWIDDQRLSRMNEKFKSFRLYEPHPQNGRRVRSKWSDELKEAGSEISRALGLDNGAQAAVLAAYVGKLGKLEHVHFRFSLPRDRMEHIPFELVWDGNREQHLRELAPVARRVLLNENQRINVPPAPAAEANVTGRVLFIRSPAHGSLAMEGRQFTGETTFNAKRLQYLGKEFSQLKRVRLAAQLAEPVQLQLSSNGATLDKVLEHLAAGPWDIVHFAGHSVCADDGNVFLLLPGSRGPIPMRVQDFAQAARNGNTRLVVLSCCESSSPDAIFRLAQAGVPAAIGFRWEVDDKEAAEFTAALHQALAHDEPVGRAFHLAVQRLKAKHVDSPTFASPILMVQDETWAVPKARGDRRTRDVVVTSALGPGGAGAGESGWSAGAAPACQNGSQGARGAG